MVELINLLTFALLILIGPPLILGILRKVKARLQNRIGSPIWQPLFDLTKLLKKDETISDTASWLFRFAVAFNLAAGLYLAMVMPWLTPKPELGNADLFLVLYLLAAMRFFTLLASLDTGSAFGGFAASREATLSFLVEPAAMLCLAALALVNKSSDLNGIFSLANLAHTPSILWPLCGGGFFLASLVELSRMPIDDTTTHLELTMVHEALILESSGRNLALWEYANMLKLMVLFGLCAQCFMRSCEIIRGLSEAWLWVGSLLTLLTLACLVAIFESIAVKLRWTKAPEFIAYALSLSLVASLIALGVRAI